MTSTLSPLTYVALGAEPSGSAFSSVSRLAVGSCRTCQHSAAQHSTKQSKQVLVPHTNDRQVPLDAATRDLLQQLHSLRCHVPHTAQQPAQELHHSWEQQWTIDNTHICVTLHGSTAYVHVFRLCLPCCVEPADLVQGWCRVLQDEALQGVGADGVAVNEPEAAGRGSSHRDKLGLGTFVWMNESCKRLHVDWPRPGSLRMLRQLGGLGALTQYPPNRTPVPLAATPTRTPSLSSLTKHIHAPPRLHTCPS